MKMHKFLLLLPFLIGIFCSNLGKTEELHEHPLILEMLKESNLQRRQKGLPPHQIDSTLCKMAQDHANYMSDTGRFSHHVNGGLMGRAKRYGWNSGYIMENIAMGQRNIKAAFTSWMNSRGHRSAILSNTSKCGFGAQKNSRGQWYWVAVYSQ